MKQIPFPPKLKFETAFKQSEWDKTQAPLELKDFVLERKRTKWEREREREIVNYY